MYDWVGDALVRALAEVAGDAWTPRVATAWTDAYGAIACLMMEGARSITVPPLAAASPESAGTRSRGDAPRGWAGCALRILPP